MNAQVASPTLPFSPLPLAIPQWDTSRTQPRIAVAQRSIRQGFRVAGFLGTSILLLACGYVLGFVAVGCAVTWSLGGDGAFEGLIVSGGLLVGCVRSGLWCWNRPLRR